MKTLITVAVAAVLAAPLPSVAKGGAFTTLYSFAEGPAGGLTLINGALYGGTWQGNCGSVFELQPPTSGSGPWTESVLYTFAASGDACFPVGAPVLGSKGSLYGLTGAGGANHVGALYELQPPASPGGAWTESVVDSFNAQPENGLIYGPDGSFYVLYGFGGVIQLFPPAQPDVGWSGVELLPSPEESRVWVSVGPNGELFDATQYGGRAKRGSVDELVPPRAPGGTWTTKVIFGCCGKAANDPNTLTAVSDGTLYGTTYGSNPPISYGAGAAFSLTPPQSSGQEWTYTLLADFGAKHPNTPLVLHNGNLYGAFTRVNGDGGAVFEMQPPTAPGRAWTTTYLHHFTNGQHPFGQLIVDKDGTIFGMTASDPTQPQSVTIFKIAPGGN